MSFLKKFFGRENFHKETESTDKVPFLQKIAIGMGEIPGVGHKTIENLALPIFNITLGVSPVLITAVLGIARFWDAITDPMAGSISDNTHTRWGRRRPYLFGSSIICGISLALIFMMPAHWSQTWIFGYFLFIALIFYTSYSFFNIPLMAIAWEVSPDYHERTRIISYKIFFSQINSLMANWLLAIATWKIFDSVLQGARVSSWIIAGVMVVFGLIPAYLVKEGTYKIALKEKKLRFIDSVREVIKNKVFLIFCLVATVRDLPSQMIATLGLYVSVYFVLEGDLARAAIYMGVAGTFSQFITMAAIPAITKFVTGSSKLQMLRIAIALLIVLTTFKWFTFHPRWPWMMVVHGIILIPPSVMMSLIMNSMMADICDYDEYHTGSRREGIYASIYSWIGKAAGSLSIIIAGPVLVMIGFDVVLPEQSESTITTMRAIFVSLPVISMIGALICLQFLPLTEENTFKIRQELERRRGTDYGLVNED